MHPGLQDTPSVLATTVVVLIVATTVPRIHCNSNTPVTGNPGTLCGNDNKEHGDSPLQFCSGGSSSSNGKNGRNSGTHGTARCRDDSAGPCR